MTTTTRPRPALLVHALVPLPHPVLRTLAQVALGVAFLAVLAQVRFAVGGAGLATLGGTTAGYLVSFVVAAALVGALAERFGTARPLAVAGAMLLGTLVIYLFGVAWLSRFAPDLGTAIAWGIAPRDARRWRPRQRGA